MRIPALVVASLALGLAAATAAELPLDLKVAAGWAENLSRTSAAANQKDAAFYSAGLTTAWHRQIDRNWQFAATTGAQYDRVPDFRATDVLRGTAGATLRRKFGLGPLAPSVEFSVTAARAGFREGGRSGWEMAGGVTAAKRFTDTWRAAVSAEWLQYWAAGAPFDIRNHRLALESTWDLTDRWQVGAGAGRLWGQVTANAAGPVYARALAGDFGASIRDYYRAIPWRVTHTYGPNWVAYRIDCHTDFWWVAVAPALTDNTSVPLRFEHYEVVNRVGVRYKTSLLTLSLLHRF